MPRSTLTAILVAAFSAATAAAGPALAAPATYDSPDAAVAALVGAIEAQDPDALLVVFGAESEDVILSGEAARDRESWADFLVAWRETHEIGEDEDGRTVLTIGFDRWPFPIPLVETADGTWHFDTEAGREELLDRRIGGNELATIELARAYVRVQAAYRQVDYDGDGVMEFASAILSDPGERNGLYWPSAPGEPESPIGDFMARAAAEGYAIGDATSPPEPYFGYLYRVLDRQGPSAPGGERSYMMDGDMVVSHALLAVPAQYGSSGVMTFLVGENGIVFERDLGEGTAEAAAAIDRYDPSEEWDPVGE
jgi:hypothetical protein